MVLQIAITVNETLEKNISQHPNYFEHHSNGLMLLLYSTGQK